MVAASVNSGADLAISQTISPRLSTVGGVVSVTIRVRNNGPEPAVGALAREVPQVDPDHPNQIARILGVKAGIRAAGCTSSRPVACGAATLAPGAVATIRVKARMLMSGSFESVVVTSSETPDPNTANNAAATGLLVRRPANVAVAVRAPALARVGEPVAYRVVATGTGRDGARSVRFCHRPPRAAARDLGARDVPLSRARVPRCAPSRPRAAGGLHRARHPRGERRRAHPAAAGDGHSARRPAGGGLASHRRRGAELRRDRLDPGLAAGSRSTASARAARTQPLTGGGAGAGVGAVSRMKRSSAATTAAASSGEAAGATMRS